MAGEDDRTDQLDELRKTQSNSDLASLPDGAEVVLMGWVHEIRDLGGLKFIILRDRTGITQVTIKKGEVPPELLDRAMRLTRESVVAVKGTLRRSEKSKLGVEVLPHAVRILNLAKTPLPMEVSGKVPADFDTRMASRFMDLRRPTEVAVFRLQHEVLKAIRSYLDERGFMEVITPKILASATEGGAQLFKVQYFDRDAYLAQSPQLYKEVLTSCFERVYEVGVYFRAEESNTPYHLNEFVSVDVEAAFIDYRDAMRILEDCVLYVYDRLEKSPSYELLKKIGGKLQKPEAHFPVVTYSKAVEMAQERGLNLNWGDDLTTPILRALSEEFNGYYFIVEWPLEAKPFYIKPHPR
ncbi:MAG: aspartate--tRNA(Asn) ligase, partial [Thermoproteota archaeon]